VIGWRKLYNEKLHNLYSSPIQQEWGDVECMYDIGGKALREKITGKTKT
jgi:hypothetical protein